MSIKYLAPTPHHPHPFFPSLTTTIALQLLREATEDAQKPYHTPFPLGSSKPLLTPRAHNQWINS